MCMDHLLLDSQETLPSGPETNNILHTIELCKANCAFMTMAINRTLDFTKAASNIALSAKMETASVVASMQWAVTCLTSQTQIPIQILPHPQGMCEYVVTDKHWLMENMLCYLSNAVKYSSGGKITIGVSLCEEGEDGSEKFKKSSLKKMFSGREKGIVRTNSSSIYAVEECVEMVSPHTGDRNIPSPLQMCISVEDEGIGIDDDKRSSLFQPFQQTMRLAGGTGLGLYSLAKRVEVLHGKYGVSGRNDSHPGSRFWFCIPYVADEMYALNCLDSSSSSYVNSHRPSINILGGLEKEEQSFEEKAGRRWGRQHSNELPEKEYAASESSRRIVEKLEDVPRKDANNNDIDIETGKENETSTHRRMVSLESSTRHENESADSSYCALIVEDSVVIAKATKRMLSKAGYQVDEAENGAIGLEKMKQKVYTIVVMDLQVC